MRKTPGTELRPPHVPLTHTNTHTPVNTLKILNKTDPCRWSAPLFSFTHSRPSCEEAAKWLTGQNEVRFVVRRRGEEEEEKKECSRDSEDCSPRAK